MAKMVGSPLKNFYPNFISTKKTAPTRTEIHKAIQRLKNGTGTDGMPADLFKAITKLF